MSAAVSWFRGRTLRERRLILVMLGLAAVTLLWALVILPVRNGLSSSRARYAAAVVELGEAEARLAAVKRIQRGQNGAVPLPLAETVRQRAEAAGLAPTAIDAPAPDRARVTLNGAAPGAVLGWIAGLEAEGALVEAATVTPAGPGLVSADVTLRARSS